MWKVNHFSIFLFSFVLYYVEERVRQLHRSHILDFITRHHKLALAIQEFVYCSRLIQVGTGGV